jgi:hypothetical protein
MICFEYFENFLSNTNALNPLIMKELPYTKIPEPPREMTSATVLVRLVDGIGFRYRWATEGLTEEDMAFQPCATSMKVGELLAHIHGLLAISESYLTDAKRVEVGTLNLDERRRQTLDTVLRIRDSLLALDDDYLAKREYKVPWASEPLPVWYLINGPLSDILTHIGQIASWRRINNNPIWRANVFFGSPP